MSKWVERRDRNFFLREDMILAYDYGRTTVLIHRDILSNANRQSRDANGIAFFRLMTCERICRLLKVKGSVARYLNHYASKDLNRILFPQDEGK